MKRIRLIKAILLLCLARLGLGQASADPLVLGPFERTRPQELSVPAGDQGFDPNQALHGSFSTPEQCRTIPQSIWVEWEGTGDCIRYYGYGLAEGNNPVVMVYFGGDVMLRTQKGARYIGDSYARQSPASIMGEMEEWARKGGRPAVFIARPGIYGSSGDHNKRRQRREIELMDRSLESLAKQFGISSFILVGHSAGGQIVAALLNRRRDISAVAISSGLVSVKQVAAFWENRREIPGRLLYDPRSFYDPVDEVDRIPRDTKTAIYVLSDPEDRSVPFFSQLYYVRRLRALGLHPVHIYAQASDRSRHLLAYHARLAAALVAQGKSAPEIRKAVLDFELSEAR